ncbi:unnamed protein product [Ceratitis capitata]|uniref:(Mediterranean fruit fly) hypothetical protein n=1 Tax=Ceratitis capitata TaxID=7213 RepID=A0A811TXX7_CERCA|nr:unnamed protein product [Ceratitis capitata]
MISSFPFLSLVLALYAVLPSTHLNYDNFHNISGIDGNALPVFLVQLPLLLLVLELSAFQVLALVLATA